MLSLLALLLVRVCVLVFEVWCGALSTLVGVCCVLYGLLVVCCVFVFVADCLLFVHDVCSLCGVVLCLL